MGMRSLFHRSKKSLTAEELEKQKQEIEAAIKAAAKKASKPAAPKAATKPADTKENK